MNNLSLSEELTTDDARLLLFELYESCRDINVRLDEIDVLMINNESLVRDKKVWERIQSLRKSSNMLQESIVFLRNRFIEMYNKDIMDFDEICRIKKK